MHVQPTCWLAGNPRCMHSCHEGAPAAATATPSALQPPGSRPAGSLREWPQQQQHGHGPRVRPGGGCLRRRKGKARGAARPGRQAAPCECMTQPQKGRRSGQQELLHCSIADMCTMHYVNNSSRPSVLLPFKWSPAGQSLLGAAPCWPSCTQHSDISSPDRQFKELKVRYLGIAAGGHKRAGPTHQYWGSRRGSRTHLLAGGRRVGHPAASGENGRVGRRQGGTAAGRLGVGRPAAGRPAAHHPWQRGCGCGCGCVARACCGRRCGSESGCAAAARPAGCPARGSCCGWTTAACARCGCRPPAPPCPAACQSPPPQRWQRRWRQARAPAGPQLPHHSTCRGRPTAHRHR